MHEGENDSTEGPTVQPGGAGDRSTGSGRALVVDDHPLVARGFAEYMTMACGVARVDVARTAAECLLCIDRDGAPALAVIDFWLPDGPASGLIAALRERCPDIRLLVVSGDDDPAVAENARDAGADGYVHKQAPPEVFAQAVATLLAGGAGFAEFGLPGTQPAPRELPIRTQALGLTERQGQVLGMMLRGLPNKRIALELAISEQTVKEHVTNILTRLGAANRLEVIARLGGRRIEQ